ncbi:hypothetical protein MM59RIKEN_07420 [Pusillibacter faecalis]|uniref:Uncharacterized protein n=1 Tax=Pusillibacter faecalis TaxID=2714358 RepID=A0A810QFX9_9FIRM|nr:hypothetical protein [Pusillibacter faecalis]BCK83423.1 hypothetical protein MM59RIKEN_07420 [Pusillibacter faecalis]
MGTVLFGCLLSGALGTIVCIFLFIWKVFAKFNSKWFFAVFSFYLIILLASMYLFVNPYVYVDYILSLVVFVVLYIPCVWYSIYLNKCYYLSTPERKEKYMRRKEQLEEGRRKRKENEQLSMKIEKVFIIGNDSKSKTGSAASRAIVGDILAGGVGSIVGASTAKKSGMTKFLIKYADGHKTVETVKDNSIRFRELIKYVEM